MINDVQIPPKEYLPERLHAQADELAELRFQAAEARGKLGDLQSAGLEKAAQKADDDLLIDAKDPSKFASPNVSKLRQQRLQAKREFERAEAAVKAAEKAFKAALADSTGERIKLAQERAEALAGPYAEAVAAVAQHRVPYVAAISEWNRLVLEGIEADWHREKDRYGVGAVPGGFRWPNWRPDGPSYRARVDVRQYVNSGMPKSDIVNLLLEDARGHEVRPGNKPEHDPFGFGVLARLERGEDG